jgi:hypothetical protein
MPGILKPLRPIQRGVSNQGGVIKLLVFLTSQFTADTEWPKRSDIAAGKIAGPTIPLITTETAARIIFDLEKGAKITSKGTGPSTNKMYEHALVGARIAGYRAENNESLDQMYNQPVIIVAVHADGSRVVLGSTFKPMTIEDEYDSGAVSGDEKGTVINAKSMNMLDFRPAILDTAVTIAETAIPAYA